MQADDIEHFKTNGYIVVEAFSSAEVATMRQHFHEDLEAAGIHHDALLTSAAPVPLANLKRLTGSIFYSPWKLQAQLRLHALANSLLQATFADGVTPGFDHPLGASQGALPFIDHVAYRLPAHIHNTDGLSLHIDRNPHTPYAGAYFRPIQSALALTDHYGGASGGLMVVPKFHHEYQTFFQEYIEQQPAEAGAFFRMHSKSYAAIQKRLLPVTVPAGSVVFWDNRLPHATTPTLISADSREAMFFSYLPDVPVNRSYYKAQLQCMAENKQPPCTSCYGSGAPTQQVSQILLAEYQAFLQ